MYENEFELSLLPEQPEEEQDELLPEAFQPRHKPFDWAEEEAVPPPADLTGLAEPDEEGTVFRSRRSILENLAYGRMVAEAYRKAHVRAVSETFHMLY